MKIAELNLRELADARRWPNRRFTAAEFPEMRDDPGARRVWITATKWVPYELVEVCTMAPAEGPKQEAEPPAFMCGASNCTFVATSGAGLAAHVRAKHGGGG